MGQGQPGRELEASGRGAQVGSEKRHWVWEHQDVVMCTGLTAC